MPLMRQTGAGFHMPGEMRRIAQFLDIPIDEARWADILEYCSFDWMKKNATKSVPLGGAFWDGGAEVFINKGVNGRWADTLSADASAEYEARAVSELGPECARWLANGKALETVRPCRVGRVSLALPGVSIAYQPNLHSSGGAKARL